MLTTSRHGTRRTHPVMFDRASVRLSLTEIPHVLGHPRKLSFRVVTENIVCDWLSTETELETLRDAITEILEAPTIEEGVRPQDLRLGDVITDLRSDDICVVSLGTSTTSKGTECTLVGWQDKRGWSGTWIAVNHLVTFTVRLPRAPEEEVTP